MRFWTREIAGWLLVLLGLFGFYICVALLLRGKIVETGPMMFIAIVVFRGGLHLLKVALAARICAQAQESALAPERAKGRFPGSDKMTR